MRVRHAIAVGILLGVLLVGAFLALAGCGNNAISVQPTNNSNVKLELLFEHDGCKVYRFLDGNPVYYADCRGAGSTTTSTKWEHMEGKVEHNFQSITVQ
jgi:Domain of unknown function (DUF4884)